MFLSRTFSAVTLLKVFDCNNLGNTCKITVFLSRTFSAITLLKVFGHYNIGKIHKIKVLHCKKNYLKKMSTNKKRTIKVEYLNSNKEKPVK